MTGAGGYGDEEIGKKDAVYTIRDLSLNHLRVFEIVNLSRIYRDPTDGNQPKVMEIWFKSFRFVPLETKAISIFRAIAANPNIKIREDA